MSTIDSGNQLRVFLSSTSLDLKSHRAKVRDSLERIEVRVVGMESWGARAVTPVEMCLGEIANCHVYVGIFGMRYGSISKGYSQSMTHLEYNKAKQLGLPCFIYLMDEKKHLVYPEHVDKYEAAKQLEQLKDELLDSWAISYFISDESLATTVTQDIVNHKESHQTRVTQDVVLNKEPLQGEEDKPAIFRDCFVKYTIIHDPINRYHRLKEILSRSGGPTKPNWRDVESTPEYDIMRDCEDKARETPLKAGEKVIVQMHSYSVFNGAVGTVERRDDNVILYWVRFPSETGLGSKRFHVMYLSLVNVHKTNYCDLL